MRRISKKRQALLDIVGPWREAFKLEIGHCEYCGKKARPDQLDAHEIVTGDNRWKVLNDRRFVMTVHRQCHNIIELHTIPWQLALFYVNGRDWDLENYWAVTGRKWPSMEQILEQAKKEGWA